MATQLTGITRKAALMDAQVDLLEGKRRSANRLLETTRRHAAEAAALLDADGYGGGATGDAGAAHGGRSDATGGPAGVGVEAGPGLAPGVSRIVLTAQEDMRREIARQMHDGPAQSLTNIVLQAQIVERLLARDPDKAAPEVHQLIAMVQRTLDATKTFIFDVRPMVLDDLGLVPTLRRASRDRGRRIGIDVDFESVGVDRRLSPELESGLFRLIDDALAAHIATRPDRLMLHLDWGDSLVVELEAGKTPVAVPDPELPEAGADLPPALAEMVEERRRTYDEAVEAARVASLSRLPDAAWVEVASRAKVLGVTAEMREDGARLHLAVELPPARDAASSGATSGSTGGGSTESARA